LKTLAFNWADYTFIIVILVSTLISLVRGFVREALSLISWIIAIWVGYEFSTVLAEMPLLKNTIATNSVRMIISFVVLFLAVVFVGAIINHVITKFIKKTGLNGTDRSLGMVFGMARGVLLVALVVLLGEFTAFSQDNWWKSSQLIPHFDTIAKSIRSVLPKDLDKMKLFNQTDQNKPATEKKNKPEQPPKKLSQAQPVDASPASNAKDKTEQPS